MNICKYFTELYHYSPKIAFIFIKWYKPKVRDKEWKHGVDCILDQEKITLDAKDTAVKISRKGNGEKFTWGSGRTTNKSMKKDVLK